VAQARLAQISLPDFGMPDAMPDVPPATYAARAARLRERAGARGHDRLVVYADREHSANLSYLTGFDPRFEEALLVLGGSGEPAILVGNECFGMAGGAPLKMRRHLFQDFSLPSQPRDRSLSLAAILAGEGVRNGSRVGVVGWKTYGSAGMMDAPAYLVDELRRQVGPAGSVENATDLLIDPADGLRVINEVEQLAAFEYSACQTSQGVRQLLSGLRPGMTEREAVRLLGWNGMPLSCHLMLTSGQRATLGLLSPGDRRIERGDRFTVAFGIWGALNCRAGFVVEDSGQLPPAIGDYVDRLVGPYFEAVAEWYTALRIGQTGGALHEIIARRLGDPFFGIFLNPGHQLHLDEWVNSPISAGSTIELRSGMVLQVDIIPATGSDYFTTNIEDGVALADRPLRDAFASAYPAAWRRIEARRRFMDEALGIHLHPDVLPFSNLPAYLPPFLLRPDYAMTLAGEAASPANARSRLTRSTGSL
jgi:Xaa-Pro aminopeptidase